MLPWKSLNPRSFTFRLPPEQSEPSATGAWAQVFWGVQLSVVQGLPSSQPPAQTGVVQVKLSEPESGQPAAASPSDTVTEIVAVPRAVQVKVGLAAVALLSIPLDAVH